TSLESTANIAQVYGASSPQAAEAKANSSKASADFVAIGVHCAKAAALCSKANGGVPDVLPQEPGGYSGYQALLGNKYVAPRIAPSQPEITALDGSVVKNSKGYAGFPGFDSLTPNVSLAYTLDMQTHGVPVTFAYISDAHASHAPGGHAYGPGQTGYEAQLAAYNHSFAVFFKRLAQAGINKSNTMFVFTTDEGDVFAGSKPIPANCDGVHVTCHYSQIGQVNGNLTGLLSTQQGVTTPFTTYNGPAPVFYLPGQPAADAPTVRSFEQALGKLTLTNPYTGKTAPAARALANPLEMRILHMVTGDPARTPTAVMFSNPAYYLSAGKKVDCKTVPASQSCVYIGSSDYAWGHGSLGPVDNTIWAGLVGPGIRPTGVNTLWSDESDLQPTMAAALGLHPDYASQGRALVGIIEPSALPASLKAHHHTLAQLGQVYSQLEAPVGQLGLASLRISTRAMEGDAAAYAKGEAELASVLTKRDRIGAQMAGLLDGAERHGQPIPEGKARSLVSSGRQLLAQVTAAAGGSPATGRDPRRDAGQAQVGLGGAGGAGGRFRGIVVHMQLTSHGSPRPRLPARS
ncbi:MAG: hypothetical protein ACRD0J_03285, partial [Acidimicrobiales bacterium]